MRWKSHVRFGERVGETHPSRAGQGAPVRPRHLREDPHRMGVRGVRRRVLPHGRGLASGTSPRCFRLSRLSSHPDRPVISAFGSRSVLVMLAPPVDAIDMKTPPTLRL
jgi:hypothetical protein